MKKTNIFFAIYSAVTILGIILFLIFYPKFSQKQDYAKSISLNCPREITFEIGDKITLRENYINIEPAEMINELKVEIYTKTTKTDPNNLKIDNREISCLSTGFYYVKFIVPGKNYDIYDTLVVHVVEKESLNYISQNMSIIQTEKKYFNEEIFTLNIDNSYTLSCSNINVSLDNNQIYSSSPTIFSLNFNFDFEFYKYSKSINILSAYTLVPDPIDPPTPSIPDEPDTPETPNTPELPDTPSEPDTPKTPEEPEEPDIPSEPEDPVTPEEPETPTEPEDPVTPEEPETPTDPEDPTEPETPEDPIEPETPTEPEDPSIPEENGYTIEVINYDSENITFAIDGTKTLFKLHYEVLYNNELCYYQAVTVQPSDTSICNVTSDSLYVYIEYIGIKGTFTLAISYGNLATKTLTITFE